MDGIHTNWTGPSRLRGGNFEIEDFELLTTILSALAWRRKNGTIKLCADETALEYYDKLGMLDIYNSTETLEVDTEIDPKMFWAAGKLYALRNQTAPVAVIDTDFIVWEEILFAGLGECTVIHFEELYPDVYPPQSFFNMSGEYKWRELDWSLPACNTAFTVIKSQKFLEYYTESAIDFMKKAKKTDDNLRYMVFAEQRLINMCAAELGIEVRAFSRLERLFHDGHGCFTHTWGMKQQMRDIPELRADFCRRCAARIKREYPVYGDLAERILKK
ncbi:MAG: DUF6734 family protein [Clostridia bacterium]|nr:DUF6734 family protein [Clostridia bacterium]